MTKPTTTRGTARRRFARSRTIATPRRKRLLVVEDNAAEQLSITELLGHDDIEIATAETGEDGARRVARGAVRTAWCSTCGCPTCPASRCWSAIRDDDDAGDIPVVVFTGRELSPEEDAQLHTLARSVVVKGVESPERLLDETALFLHRVVADLPAEKQHMLERLHRSDEDLVGTEGAGGRRRRAQHLRAQQRARAARHAGADRHDRQRGDRDAGSRHRISPSC